MDKLIARIQNNSPGFLALASGIALIASVGCTSSTSPSMEQGVPQAVTTWAPVGARTVGDYDYEIIP